eukprot:s1586_g16.t1
MSLETWTVSNVQMRLGAEMLHEEEIENDEFVPDWEPDDIDDKYDDVDLPVGSDQPVNMQELIFVACTRWRQVKAEADAQEVEATERPELVEEEPEEPSSEAKKADGGGLTPPLQATV